jgi:hypothetical protein
LLFGDVDGDGRTDVVSKAGNQLRVTWAGTSDVELLYTSAESIADGFQACVLSCGRRADDRRSTIAAASSKDSCWGPKYM